MLNRNQRLVVFSVTVVALLVTLTFLPASAQLSQWRSLNPTRDGTLPLPAPYLYGVQMLSPNYGWAVGGNCTIYGADVTPPCGGFALFWDGIRWREVLIPANSGTLTSVFIVSQNDVWAVGTRNATSGTPIPTILHWDGISWVQVLTPLATLQLVSDLFGVFMLPGGTDGWVVGTPSSAGGATNVLRWSGTWPTGSFSAYPALGTPDVLRSVSLLSSTHGWIVGSATAGGVDDPSIFRWDGAGWLSVATDPALATPPGTGDLLSVYPVSTSDAWAVGEMNTLGQSTILRWNGASWTGPMVAPTANIDYRSVHMVTATDGWIAGTHNPTTDEGLLLRWNGVAWSIVRSWVTVDLNDIFLLPGGAQGASVGDAETIIHWNGSIWFARTSPTFRNLNAISMVAANDGWAVGHNGTIFKYDGNSWSHYETLPSGVPLYGLHMRSSTDGWAVGDSPGSGFPPTILRWNGAAWTTVTPSGVALGRRLRAIDTISPTESWAVGNSTTMTPATMLKWDGTIWTSVPSGTLNDAELHSIDMLSSTDGWAVGCADQSNCAVPIIVRWNGLAWSSVTPPAGIAGLRDVFMLSPTNGWAVGVTAADGQATIIHWDGVQWRRVPATPTGSGGGLFGLHMLSPTDGWAVGNSTGPLSLILHWDGLTWNVVSTPPVPPSMIVRLTSIFMVSPLDGWIVAYDGLILHYGPEIACIPTTTTTSLTQTSTVTETATSTTTTTSTTTMAPGGAVPGFPIESILAGLVGGAAALTIIRRRRNARS